MKSMKDKPEDLSRPSKEHFRYIIYIEDVEHLLRLIIFTVTTFF